MPRITRKQWADFHAVNAPPNAILPDSINQKPRADAGKKRGRQGETTWLHSIIKPFKPFVRLLWVPGMVWLARNNNGAYKLPSGGWLKYGLGTGTSDAIGWTCVQITQEMVGTVIAQFTAFEAKQDGAELQEAQSAFLQAVENSGGRALRGSPSAPPRI